MTMPRLIWVAEIAITDIKSFSRDFVGEATDQNRPPVANEVV
jgi:hypothetical protein